MVWGALRPRPGAVGAMVLLLLCKFGGSRHAVGLLVLVCFAFVLPRANCGVLTGCSISITNVHRALVLAAGTTHPA